MAAIAFVYQLGLIVPFMLIFPHFFGLDGVMYSTPTADAMAFVFAMALLWDDLWKMPKKALDLEAF